VLLIARERGDFSQFRVFQMIEPSPPEPQMSSIYSICMNGESFQCVSSIVLRPDFYPHAALHCTCLDEASYHLCGLPMTLATQIGTRVPLKGFQWPVIEIRICHRYIPSVQKNGAGRGLFVNRSQIGVISSKVGILECSHYLYRSLDLYR